ncbi:hypothetical protein [Acidithiobacillus sp. IBUN Pt1247-S3]|uniref:hypothetical protein n=1 Tax=Acidithiobacillus sp. IBUN Pt1247-S3 TaxID=3166642 RepID=UPI0034E45686
MPGGDFCLGKGQRFRKFGNALFRIAFYGENDRRIEDDPTALQMDQEGIPRLKPQLLAGGGTQP